MSAYKEAYEEYCEDIDWNNITDDNERLALLKKAHSQGLSVAKAGYNDAHKDDDLKKE